MDIVAAAKAYLSSHRDACAYVENCIGDGAREVIEGLCAEVERLESLCEKLKEGCYEKYQDEAYAAYHREIEQSLANEARNSAMRAEYDAEMRRDVWGETR